MSEQMRSMMDLMESNEITEATKPIYSVTSIYNGVTAKPVKAIIKGPYENRKAAKADIGMKNPNADVTFTSVVPDKIIPKLEKAGFSRSVIKYIEKDLGAPPGY